MVEDKEAIERTQDGSENCQEECTIRLKQQAGTIGAALRLAAASPCPGRPAPPLQPPWTAVLLQPSPAPLRSPLALHLDITRSRYELSGECLIGLAYVHWVGHVPRP